MRMYNLRELFSKNFYRTQSLNRSYPISHQFFFSFIISPESNELSVHKYFTFDSFFPSLALLYSPSTNVQEKLASMRQ